MKEKKSESQLPLDYALCNCLCRDVGCDGIAVTAQECCDYLVTVIVISGLTVLSASQCQPAQASFLSFFLFLFPSICSRTHLILLFDITRAQQCQSFTALVVDV